MSLPFPRLEDQSVISRMHQYGDFLPPPPPDPQQSLICFVLDGCLYLYIDTEIHPHDVIFSCVKRSKIRTKQLEFVSIRMSSLTCVHKTPELIIQSLYTHTTIRNENSWKKADIVTTCAPKNNDDWYWLFAAVYTGGGVLVVTNDEMRDHHFSMLRHRSFQRWKERHQVRRHLCVCVLKHRHR